MVRKFNRSQTRVRRLEFLEHRHLLAADPIISEFLASNQSVLVDPNDKTPDWIEIHNAGDEAIDLAGWYLTDDPTEPNKWVFPNHLSSELGPDEYLIVRASDEDIIDRATGNLHTNFKLSAGGEYVALVSPDLSIISEFGADGEEYPEQFEDVSYGVASNGDIGYFRDATPGEANSNATDGFVEDTKFSVDRGFFDRPFTVDVTTTTIGATIVYTTDGSEPTLTNGTSVVAANNASPVATVSIDTTTTLRAVAFKSNYEATNVDTQTYLFLDDVVQQPRRPSGFPSSWSGAPAADYELDPQIVDDPAYTEDLLSGLREIPTVSLVSEVDGLFGSGGIYTNPNNASLEVPTSIEWILPNGETEFQIDAGLKISGGASRNTNNSPKHSMSLRFRSEYGSGRLNHDLFEDSPVDSFNSLQLRAMYNNSWIHWSSEQQHRGTLIRDQFVRDSLIAMGQDDAGHGTYAHVYINGLYWGVYNVHERPDSAHYAEYHGGDADDFDAYNGTSLIDGTRISYNQMRSTVTTTNDWAEVEAVLDVDNFIDWTIVNAYAGNDDVQLNGNWRAAGGGSGRGEGLWRIYAWDSERILEGVTERPLVEDIDPMQIRDELFRFPEFRLRFGDRAEQHLKNGGALTPEKVAERWQTRVDELQNAIVAESARWGDYRRDVHRRGNDIELYTRDTHWLPEHERLYEEYFPRRSDITFDRMQRVGWLPDLATPAFQVNNIPQHGGELSPRDAIGFTVESEQVTVTASQQLIGPDSTVLATVPSDNSMETGDGPFWYEAAFDAAGWTSGTNGVGYENSAGGSYDDRLGTDVGSEWNARRSSVYTRFEFNVDQGFDAFDSLTLNMTYDDGFVVYLNGQFIDVDPGGNQNFAPDTVRWNSNSTGDDRPDSVVLSRPIEFDLTQYRDLLKVGTNLLAIHGLNQSAGSSDMLIEPELVLQRSEVRLPDIFYTLDGSDPRSADGTSNGTLFTAPFELTESATVMARMRVGEEWSALLTSEFLISGPIDIRGDIDGDGTVGFTDFLILSSNFGQTSNEDLLDGDLDGDGTVGFTDFLILSANFGV